MSTKKTPEQQLRDHALANADTREIQSRLFEKGYRPTLLMKSPSDVVQWSCDVGGRGISATHVWKATPLEALSEDGGCPWCELERRVKEDPPEQVEEAVLLKAIKAQHKIHADNIKRAKKKSRRFGSSYGLDRYAV